jgi:hypothetical protein
MLGKMKLAARNTTPKIKRILFKRRNFGGVGLSLMGILATWQWGGEFFENDGLRFDF